MILCWFGLDCKYRKHRLAKGGGNINLKKFSFSFYSITVFLYIVTLFTVSSNSDLYMLNRISFFIMSLVFFLKIIRKNFILGRGFKYTFPFYCMVVLSNLWAFDIDTSLHRTIGISFYYLGGLVVYLSLINKLVSVKTVKISAFISLLTLTISASYEYYITGLIRASGVTENANTFGLNIIFLGLILIYLIEKKGAFNIFIKSLTFMMILNAIVLSGSRKIIIATVLIIAYYYFKNYFTSLSKLKIAANAMLLFLMIIFIIINSHYLVGILNNVYGFERLIMRDDNSFSDRENMIATAINLFKERPILGYGIDNFRVISSFNTYSHNNFTELLVSLGVLGFIMYYFIYLNLIKLSLYVYQKIKKSEVFIFTVFYVTLILIQEIALVTINSPRNWIILFLLFWINEKFLKEGRINIKEDKHVQGTY